MFIEKSLYISQLKRIPGLKDNKNIVEHFNHAYTLYENFLYNKPIDRAEVNATVSDLLAYLYKGMSEHFSIPMSFIESPVGVVLFTLLFGVSENIFTTSDVSIMMGITRALISHDFKANNITALKRDKAILIYERDLKNYMKSKGIYEEEAREIIAAYLNLTNQNCPKEEIIKELDVIRSRHEK